MISDKSCNILHNGVELSTLKVSNNNVTDLNVLIETLFTTIKLCFLPFVLVKKRYIFIFLPYFDRIGTRGRGKDIFYVRPTVVTRNFLAEMGQFLTMT